MEAPNQDHWHIKKEVTVGHIVTTILLILGIMSAWTSLDKRLVVQETVLGSHIELDIDRDARHARGTDKILEELRLLRKDLQEFIVSGANRK